MQRTAIRCEKGPFAFSLRFRERTLHVTEQGVEQQVLIKRPAVDADERPLRPAAVGMNRLCRELFTGTGLADDEHVGGDGCGLAYEGT